ncbi:hypothetical protein [Halpernia frigidisoli]|uniref:Uncharacterized protein n=1 Tax=Halpernia frigidisoli TaxID=1125876 RepID=A0A1I3IU89_9FLAO|nr:hypothetical protein [Halpernia frigidisoli]SFI51509.1 hypothetical protein SAMN05443292_2786 [Halpernia frigidisoli]
MSFLLFNILGFAQNQNDIGKIQLAIFFNIDQQNKFEPEILEKIEGKLSQLLSNYAIASTSYNNGLLLEPNIIINGNDIVEGGMQNINVTNITLQLKIKQDQSNVLFTSFSKTLKGTGRTQELALNNAINSLSPSDPLLINFINSGTEKILKYYEENCTQIINKSSTLEKSGNYEESLALLLSIPESASCYKTAQNKSLSTYKNFQKMNCTALIMQAKISIAEKDFNSAFTILSDIENTSPCSSESISLIKNIEAKISAEDKKQWDLQLKMYNDAVSLEKNRINAIKEIAVAFYKSQKRTNNLIIVR